jgi:hypothetical protein
MPHPGEKCLAHFELFFQTLAEPGPRVLPVSVGHRPGEPQCLARLLDGEPAEKVKVSYPRRGGVFLAETGEQLIQRQHEVGVLREGTDLIEQLEPHPPSSPLQPLAVPGVVDQDPPHRFRRSGEEVRPALELLVADQPQIGLMDQGGGVKRVPGPLRGHPRGREFAQLIVDERKELGGRPAVACRCSVHEVGDLGHDNGIYRLRRDVNTEARRPALPHARRLATTELTVYGVVAVPL